MIAHDGRTLAFTDGPSGDNSTAMTVSDIYNYRQAAPDLGTSGQPRDDQLATIVAAGYEVIINLALHDDPRYSLADEQSSVQALGIEYVHIPVQFSAPTEHDLALFIDVMDRCKGCRVWVHCAANMRVTAFLGLYWTLHVIESLRPHREIRSRSRREADLP
jgi:protein tyrosine phosphatase (PTP) superfamily phosphohydrolase (DUF442 family)